MNYIIEIDLTGLELNRHLDHKSEFEEATNHRTKGIRKILSNVGWSLLPNGIDRKKIPVDCTTVEFTNTKGSRTRFRSYPKIVDKLGGQVKINWLQTTICQYI